MIEVNNLTASKIDDEFLRKIAKVVLKGEKETGMELSIALVGQKEIKELNRKYRKKNRATDVLSFAYDRSSGEVIICPVQAKKELSRVLIHGILHLLDFKHKEMKAKEDYYLSKI